MVKKIVFVTSAVQGNEKYKRRKKKKECTELIFQRRYPSLCCCCCYYFVLFSFLFSLSLEGGGYQWLNNEKKSSSSSFPFIRMYDLKGTVMVSCRNIFWTSDYSEEQSMETNFFCIYSCNFVLLAFIACCC